jgi:hypothetical protein
MRDQGNPQTATVAIPLELTVGIGGFFGTSYGVELVGADIEYTFSTNRDSKKEPRIVREQFQVTARKWAIFRKRLDAINVWCWHADYPNPGVCDGTGWSLSIRYPDKILRSSGDNNYPAEDVRPANDCVGSTPFQRLLAAVRELTGREFR